MRKLVLVMGLVVVAFACSEQAGQMLVDGGQMMMDAGDAMVPDAGAQGTPAECNKREPISDSGSFEYWAEFPVTPGRTEVTVCVSGYINTPPYNRDNCYRKVADWIHGTSTGVVGCFTGDSEGSNTIISITVHD